MDIVSLCRLQFAFTTAFHILFPTLTMGLAVYLVIVEWLWLRKGQEIYYRMYRFWVKIFAIHFAVGVVSGVTLAFQFGTNFARFSQAVANVFAPLLAYEAMTAFFLEAGFLGIMLFGWKRVPPGVHFLATCLVAVGASFSAFWIMAANAWMQTPAGFRMEDGIFIVTSFRQAIFNPAFPTHLAHMLMASYVTTAFAVGGISAFFLAKGEHPQFYKRSLALAMLMAAFCAPLQILLGDFRGINVAEHQPAKLAAMEAHWDTNTVGGAPLILFAVPDLKEEKNSLEVSIPNLLSLLVTRSWDGRVTGLKEFSRADRPNVPVTFFSFRLMAGIGFVFLLVMLWALWLWWNGRLYTSRPFLKALIFVQPLGFIATLSGWVVAEVGRQPWVVYGLMRTEQGISPVAAGNVIWSICGFIAVISLIGASYFYYTIKTLRQGPDLESPVPPVQRPAGMGGQGRS